MFGGNWEWIKKFKFESASALSLLLVILTRSQPQQDVLQFSKKLTKFFRVYVQGK